MHHIAHSFSEQLHPFINKFNCRLLLNRSGGPSGMRAEHLRQWLIAITRDDAPDATNWLKVVAIMQAAYCDGTLAEECTQQTVVLIPKREGRLPG